MSKKEANRYQELKDRVRTGFVRNLRCQVEYPCEVNGTLVCKYIADFVYDQRVAGEGWQEVVEDVKGYYGRAAALAVFRLKAKLVKAIHGVEIKVFK